MTADVLICPLKGTAGGGGRCELAPTLGLLELLSLELTCIFGNSGSKQRVLLAVLEGAKV